MFWVSPAGGLVPSSLSSFAGAIDWRLLSAALYRAIQLLFPARGARAGEGARGDLLLAACLNAYMLVVHAFDLGDGLYIVLGFAFVAVTAEALAVIEGVVAIQTTRLDVVIFGRIRMQLGATFCAAAAIAQEGFGFCPLCEFRPVRDQLFSCLFGSDCGKHLDPHRLYLIGEVYVGKLPLSIK